MMITINVTQGTSSAMNEKNMDDGGSGEVAKKLAVIGTTIVFVIFVYNNISAMLCITSS